MLIKTVFKNSYIANIIWVVATGLVATWSLGLGLSDIFYFRQPSQKAGKVES